MIDINMMKIGELKKIIKEFPDDMPISFACSCSRKGGYDGWEIEITPEESYVEFYLRGYHDE